MSALSIDPNADALFGIEIEYNDDDDGDTQDTKVKTFNSGASLWNDPSEMGTVRLDSRVAYDFLDVSMADAPFAIDGMEDAAWANYPLISSNQWVDGPLGAELGWQDNSFDFRAAWYSDNLYVIVYASHDTLIEDRPAGQEVQYWNDTSIEFWLDFDNSKSVESKDDNDVNFGFSWDAASGVDETIGGNMADTVKTAMQRAAMVTKYGVIYELAIPLALAPTPLALQEGTVFGFDIGNIDDDAGSSTKATYWATTNTIWKDPSLWGTAKLMGPLVSGVDEKIAVELNYELSQNYPNPFNPTTNIAYSIPKDSHVKLTIFNTLGQRVATLVDSRVQAGKHIVRFDAHRLPSGIYFYRLQAGKTVMNKKLMLLK
ncbi:MAG: T9SS C-terminal target domain-containing protein [Calditrichaeota bacterium]|nr:MAG: T9SS C-terminal target domain-containing protein [Calditrichota bacterium]